MVKSRSAKAIILASGKVLTSFVAIASAAVLARLFSKLDYATYRQTMLAYAFAAPFVTLGIQRALYYFLPDEEERPRGVLIENLLLLVGGGLLLAVFLLAGGSHWLARRFNNPDLVTTLLILAPYPLLMLPAGSLSACLLARNRAEQVAVFNVLSRLGMFLVMVIPCLIWPRPTIAVTMTVVAAAMSTAAALTLMFRACPAGQWRPTLSGMRSQLIYAVPLGLSTLVGTVTRSLGQVMVAAMCSPEAFAVFVNGAIELPLVGVVAGSVTSVLIVDYTKLYRQGRLTDIVALMHRAMVKCALLLLPMMAFLLCLAPELMRLVFGPTYEASAAPFRVYLLLLPIRTLNFGAILMATGNSRYILIQSILTLAAIASVSWYAIGVFGPIGAAVASVLATYFLVLPYLLVIMRKILHCPVRSLFPWSDLFKVAVASVAGVFFALIAKHVLTGWSDVLVLMASGMLYGTTTLALFVWCEFLSLASIGDRIRASMSGGRKS